MKVSFLDLRVDDLVLRRELLGKVDTVLQHGRFMEGPEQNELERRISEIVGVKYAVGVGSGSSALYLALKAIGIGKGDEVITTPFTWIITTHAIVSTGARPVFVDVKRDYNIDPSSVERAITKRTKAIVPVHVGGHMCDMKSLTRIAHRYKLKIVEDAAQAFCASLKGRRAGSFSAAASFSMNPMKVLHAYGETGAVTTNNKSIEQTIQRLRHAGTKRDKYGRQINICNVTSLNHKIDTVQAAMLLVSLGRIDTIWKIRNDIASVYDSELKDVVATPVVSEDEVHGRYLYMVACKKRDKLMQYLKNWGIESKAFYSPLTCDAEVYSSNKKREFKIARNLQKQCIALPLHEKLNEVQVEYVIDKVKDFYRQN